MNVILTLAYITVLRFRFRPNAPLKPRYIINNYKINKTTQTLRFIFRNEKMTEFFGPRTRLQPEFSHVLRFEAAKNPRPLNNKIHRSPLSLKSSQNANKTYRSYKKCFVGRCMEDHSFAALIIPCTLPCKRRWPSLWTSRFPRLARALPPRPSSARDWRQDPHSSVASASSIQICLT